MISPALPAELRAALDAKLEGLARQDVAAALPRSPGPIATVATPARSHPRPMRSPMRWRGCRRPMRLLPQASMRCRTITARLRAAVRCSMSAPDRARRAGRRPQAFPTLAGFTLLDANPALRTLALEFAKGSSRLRAATYELGPAHASLAQAGEADLVIASYLIGELGESERRDLVGRDVGQDARYAPHHRARHARGLRPHHRCARAADRSRRACRRALPA